MTQISTQQFTVSDPRDFDGDPYDVAKRACLQAGAVARVLKDTVADARVMVRNAELERQMARDEQPSAIAFEDSIHATKLDTVAEAAEAAEKALAQLARAAGFNPKAPLNKA